MFIDDSENYCSSKPYMNKLTALNIYEKVFIIQSYICESTVYM